MVTSARPVSLAERNLSPSPSINAVPLRDRIESFAAVMRSSEPEADEDEIINNCRAIRRKCFLDLGIILTHQIY
jgi:hypothetical protein